MTQRSTTPRWHPQPSPSQIAWRSLRHQFLYKLLWPLLLAFVLAASLTAVINYRQGSSEQRQWRMQMIETFSKTLIKPLWDCDDATTRGIVHTLSQMPSVHSVQLQDMCAGITVEVGTLSDAAQITLAEHRSMLPSLQMDSDSNQGNDKGMTPTRLPISPLALPTNTALPQLLLQTLEYRDEHNRRFVVGHLVLEFTPFSALQASSRGLVEQLITFAAILLAVFSVVALVFRITIERPLTLLHQAMLRQETVHGTQAPERQLHDELTDVTDVYNQLLQELQSQAQNDALTGLGNRTVLEQHLRQALTLARANQATQNARSYVLLLDLDNFKPINDTYGHTGGDFVLQTVAQRLREVSNSSDIITRLGGDEFVIIAHNCTSEQEVARSVQRIVQAVEAPIQFGPHQLHVGVSVGYACIDPSAPNLSSSESLMAQADQAMYVTKHARKTQGQPTSTITLTAPASSDMRREADHENAANTSSPT